jgi:transposase-like protein
MAVKSVREDGKSIHRVAKESGITYSTLQKRLKQGLVSANKMRRKPAQNVH